MAQNQNRASAIALAFALLPQFVHAFRDQNTPGTTNEQRHSTVFDLTAAVLALGGVIVGQNNPSLAPLINQTISETVNELKADDFQKPPVPVLAAAPSTSTEPKP